MKCPYCEIEMQPGRILRDRFEMKWVKESDFGTLRHILSGNKVRIVDPEENPDPKAYYCEKCKLIIVKLK